MPRDLATLRTTLGHPDATPIAKLIGFHLVELHEGRAVFAMEAGPQHHNPMGTVHGGVFVDMADAAMGFAYVSTLEDGESFTTLELKVNYLRPFFKGKLIAEANLVKGGRSVGMVECDVKDEQGRLIARASSTCMTLRGEQAKGR